VLLVTGRSQVRKTPRASVSFASCEHTHLFHRALHTTQVWQLRHNKLLLLLLLLLILPVLWGSCWWVDGTDTRHIKLRRYLTSRAAHAHTNWMSHLW